MTRAGGTGKSNGHVGGAPDAVGHPEAGSRRGPRPVLGEEGWRWLGKAELSLLPRQVRPDAVAWTWVGLGVVLLVMAVIAVAIVNTL